MQSMFQQIGVACAFRVVHAALQSTKQCLQRRCQERCIEIFIMVERMSVDDQWSGSNRLFFFLLLFPFSLLLGKIQVSFYLFFISNLILILSIVIYLSLSLSIIFLIRFCFQFHPLTFNFNLFLCQIWSPFFLLLFVCFKSLFYCFFLQFYPSTFCG